MAYRSDGSIPLTVQKTLLFPDFIILSFLPIPEKFSYISPCVTSEIHFNFRIHALRAK